MEPSPNHVMTGLDPVIHERSARLCVDGRIKSGHDGWCGAED
jgi:hypothetical protein